jgi:hypothetical protein
MVTKSIQGNYPDVEENPPSTICFGKNKYGELAGAEVLWDKKRRWLSQSTTVTTPIVTCHGL